jgi:osmotically-inducible protein OsmY
VIDRTLFPWRGFLSVAAMLGLAALLPGCIPVIAAGGAASGYAMAQERGPVQQVKDSGIKATITHSWEEVNPQMASQLDANVYDGQVLITGSVANPEWSVDAVRLAWQAEGVKQVNSEIQVADKSTLTDQARDTWITTRLRTAILTDGKIRSLNYSIETVNGVVYLMGSARTQGELDLVTNYARNIPNVKRVVSYVQVRPGEPSRPAMPATAAPVYQAPAGGAAPYQPPATSAYPSPSYPSPSYSQQGAPPAYQPPSSPAPAYQSPGAPTPLSPSRPSSIEVTPLQ